MTLCFLTLCALVGSEKVFNILPVSIPAPLFPAPIQQWAVWDPYPVGMFRARGNTRAFSGSQPKVRRF